MLVDERLDERAYLLGDDYSLVDLVVGDVITYATYAGVTVEGDRTRSWLDRVQARPSFQSAWAA